MKNKFAVSFVPESDVKKKAGSGWEIVKAGVNLQIPVPSKSLARVLHSIEDGETSQYELADYFQKSSDVDENTESSQWLTVLAAHGLLCQQLVEDGAPIATLVGRSNQFRIPEEWPDLPERLIMSPYSFLRYRDANTVLSSPIAHAELRLHDPKVADLLARLADASYVSVLEEDVSWWTKETLEGLLGLLLEFGFAHETSIDGEDCQNDLQAHWEFHDLLFHTQSRLGRHSEPYGGTFRTNVPKEDAVKPTSGPVVMLPRPDMRTVIQDDRPFAEVLESRHSVRNFSQENPITVRQLGEFLYRTARVRGSQRIGELTVTDRPYPTGGALHSLEIYPAVRRCGGIDEGLYHYCPENHWMSLVDGPSSRFQALIEGASVTANAKDIQILLIISSRFQRVYYKYSSMAYALILKEVGVLMQTMYLNATAMGLGCCALGGGDADLFAVVNGTNYLKETSVGEFLIGTAE